MSNKLKTVAEKINKVNGKETISKFWQFTNTKLHDNELFVYNKVVFASNGYF